MEEKAKEMFDRLLKRKESFTEQRKTVMQDLRVARKLSFNTECEKLIFDKAWIDEILQDLEEDLIELQSF